MAKEEVLTPRRLNMLPTFQRFFNMPLTDPFIELSREEYKDLLGLITTLEEENKRLFDYAQRVYSAVNSDYTTIDEEVDDGAIFLQDHSENGENQLEKEKTNAKSCSD